MSTPEDNTRPLSVADLLARNGTIGSPPVGGRRRRRRRNSDGVSVSELTGEIPVVSADGGAEEYLDEYVDEDAEECADEDAQEDAQEEAGGYVEVYGVEAAAEHYEQSVAYQQATDAELVVESSQAVVVYSSAEVPEYATEYVAAEVPDYVAEESGEAAIESFEVDSAGVESAGVEPVDVDVEESVVRTLVVESPPLAADPLPHRSEGPERGFDPRPVRRSSGAEQMAYDPVDESVVLDDLVVEDVEQLRSYLSASQDTLFSGGTVADDLARRGLDSDDRYEKDGAETYQAETGRAEEARPRNVGSALWNSVLAVIQSLMAVVLGAALFIGFDQLWRWNNLVALILSVLVVLSLAAGVRYVRKTEDIVSTLTAVAVGLLVTLGPLALQST